MSVPLLDRAGQGQLVEFVPQPGQRPRCIEIFASLILEFSPRCNALSVHLVLLNRTEARKTYSVPRGAQLVCPDSQAPLRRLRCRPQPYSPAKLQSHPGGRQTQRLAETDEHRPCLSAKLKTKRYRTHGGAYWAQARGQGVVLTRADIAPSRQGSSRLRAPDVARV